MFALILYFNPRSREGSDYRTSDAGLPSIQFQSTLPRRERLKRQFKLRCPKRNFNPRSREGSDPLCLSFIYVPANFNPRSREGSDFTVLKWLLMDSISIHAPAKGATKHEKDGNAFYMDFNPRSREGSDVADNCTFVTRFLISIHAPAKGATTLRGCESLVPDISIHAPAKGATSSETSFRSFW